MAIRGQRPTATVLKLVTGAQKAGATGEGERAAPQPEGKPKAPRWLTPDGRKFWRQYITRAFWLTWADESKAGMWCNMMGEYASNPGGFSATMVGQLRYLGSELGMDPMGRSRMTGGGTGGAQANGFNKYT